MRRAIEADFASWLKPQDVARVVMFLCGDEAKGIHGAAIPVFGDR
jgi:NAD(P)-dependent dehydrogenase (short-subunit alcohol dehydrogenase family)